MAPPLPALLLATLRLGKLNGAPFPASSLNWHLVTQSHKAQQPECFCGASVPREACAPCPDRWLFQRIASLQDLMPVRLSARQAVQGAACGT